MYKYTITIALVLTIASCTTTAVVTEPDVQQPVSMTPVIWKQNAPRAVRVADYRECDTAAVGGHPSMPEAQINQLAQVVDPAAREKFRTRCLTIKGYTVTERPTCSRDDVQNGIFVRSADITTLPPLSTVKCFYPEAGGFVTA